MSPVTAGQKVFFAVICAAALLVAVLGLFNPAYLASILRGWFCLPCRAICWFDLCFRRGFYGGVPAGATPGGSALAVQLIGIWTGMLFIISLLNLGAFDFPRLPVWIWFASYIIYPIIAIWMTIRQPQMMQAGDLPGPALPGWARGFLVIQGVLVTAVALLLFFFPAFMVTLWPWKVTQVLAQMYAGPLLSYGLGSLLFSRQEKWLGVKAIVPAMMLFSDAALISSLIHFDVFAFAGIADIVWFGWFAISTVVLAIMAFTLLQVRGNQSRNPTQSIRRVPR